MDTEKILGDFKSGKISLFMLKRKSTNIEELGERDFCFQKKDGLFCPVLFESEHLAKNFNDDLSSSWEIHEISYDAAENFFGKIYGSDRIMNLGCILYTEKDDLDPHLRGKICSPFKVKI